MTNLHCKIIFMNKKINRKTKKLRYNLNKSELLLSDILKKTSLNIKFLSKYPINNIIVDFYSPKNKIAIEISWNKNIEDSRTKIFKDNNIKYLRVTKEDILFDRVELMLIKIIQTN